MSAPIPDKFARTARLLVKVTDGKCTLHDGGELPKMKPGITAELVISPWDVIDETSRAKLLEEHSVEFLPAGTTLWARVKSDDISGTLALACHSKRIWPGTPGLFVDIHLAKAVQLIIRGDGRASLGDCVCKIPALPDEDCTSINEAYTRISEAFEPSRRSHTGNIFNCVFYERGNYLFPLGKLRDEKLAAPFPPKPAP